MFTYLIENKPEYGNYTARDCSRRYFQSNSLYEYLGISPKLAEEQPICILALRYPPATVATKEMLMSEDPTLLQEHIFKILIHHMFSSWA